MPGPRPCHTCHFTSGAGPDMSGPYKATDPIRRPQLVKAQSPYIFKMHLPQDGPPGAGRPVAAVHFCRQVRVQHGGAFCRAAASCRYARQRAESGGCMAAAALLHGGAGHILPVPPRGAGGWRKMHTSGCRHFSSLHSGQRRILSARHGGPPESLPVGQRDLLQSAGAAGIQLCGRRLYRCRLDHLQDVVQRLRAAGHQSAGRAVLHVHAAHGQHVCAALRAADPVARLLQCMASSDGAAPKIAAKGPGAVHGALHGIRPVAAAFAHCALPRYAGPARCRVRVYAAGARRRVRFQPAGPRAACVAGGLYGYAHADPPQLHVYRCGVLFAVWRLGAGPRCTRPAGTDRPALRQVCRGLAGLRRRTAAADVLAHRQGRLQ